MITFGLLLIVLVWANQLLKVYFSNLRNQVLLKLGIPLLILIESLRVGIGFHLKTHRFKFLLIHGIVLISNLLNFILFLLWLFI